MSDSTKANSDQFYTCEYCDQAFHIPAIKIASFLYGIFFLIGKKRQFFGIVCPKCINTNVFESSKSKLRAIYSQLKNGKLENTKIYRDFWYHSSFFYFAKDKPSITTLPLTFVDSYIYHMEGLHNQEISWGYDGIVNPGRLLFSDYIYIPGRWKPKSFNNLLYSNNTAFSEINGVFGFVTLCDHKGIKQIVEIENKERIRIIPRYIVKNDLILRIERYCWKYYIRKGYHPYRDDIQPFVDNDFSIATDLMHLLAYGSEIINDFTNPKYHDPNIDLFQCQFTKKHPFYQIQIDENFDENAYREKFGIINKQEIREMVDPIIEHFNKTNIQDILNAMPERFVREYIKLTQEIDFSFSSVWRLKENFLKQLYDATKSQYKKNKAKHYLNSIDKRHVVELEEKYPSFAQIVSNYHRINEIKLRLADRVEQNGRNCVFLLLGETGTGKVLFARAIHELTGRDRPFIAENICSLPYSLFASEAFGYKKGSHNQANTDYKGLFERANGGTIFLDEIGDLEPQAQTALLRVIQEREIRPIGATKPIKIDVVFIAATNKRIFEDQEKSLFRRDLYMRFKRFEEKLPPLRERTGDILILTKFFINKYSSAYNIDDLIDTELSHRFLETLEKYHWPGNIRELDFVLENMISERSRTNDKSRIDLDDLPAELKIACNVEEKRRNFDIRLPGNTRYTDEQVLEAMRINNNNKKRAAEKLGCSWNTVNKRWKEIEEKNRAK